MTMFVVSLLDSFQGHWWLSTSI